MCSMFKLLSWHESHTLHINPLQVFVLLHCWQAILLICALLVFDQADLNHRDPKTKTLPGGKVAISLPQCNLAAQNLVLSSGEKALSGSLEIWGASEAPNSWCLTITSHDSWLAFCDSRFMSSCVWWLRSCSSRIVNEDIINRKYGFLPPSFNGGSFGSKTSTFLHLVGPQPLGAFDECFRICLVSESLPLVGSKLFWVFLGGPLCTSCSCCFSLSLAHWVQNDYVFGLPKIFHNPGTFDSLTTEKKNKKRSWPFH